MSYGKFISTFTLLGAGVLSAGCASTIAKSYPGAELPGDRIAVINNNPMIATISDRGVMIASVDGAKVSLSSYAVQVTPGAHLLGLQCSFRVDPILLGGPYEPTTTNVRKSQIRQYPGSLTVNTEAGHSYRLHVTLQPDQTCKARLMDVTGR